MQDFNPADLKKIHIPKPDSHKGQNGKVMVIAGSKLFHAAALWSLEAAAHIADMVYFASTQENNEIVRQAKKQFRNGIVVPRNKIDDYIKEADSILIGPGLPRPSGQETGDNDTRDLTKRLLTQHPDKRWVIDGGSLQVMEPEWIPPHSILTPHSREFITLFQSESSQISHFKFLISNKIHHSQFQILQAAVQRMAEKYKCVIVLKGMVDIVGSSKECVTIAGGNAGMTKGGTGDVLAGTAVGLYAKNDPFLAACAASYFNKKAAERLFKSKGYWYTTSELVDVIPEAMKEVLNYKSF